MVEITLKTSSPSDVKAQNDSAYIRMLWCLGLIAAYLVYFFCFRQLSFNFGLLNGLVIFGAVLAPCAAFWVFLFGPSSLLKKIGLILTVPLALLSIIATVLFEYVDGSLEYAAMAIAHGGVSQRDLREYSPGGGSEVIGQGQIGGNTLRLERYSAGAFSSYHYTIQLDRPLGQYFHQNLKFQMISPGRTPELVVRSDGGYDLKVDDRTGREVYRGDVMLVLDGKSPITNK